MKKILTYAACLAVAFTSCSKDSFENAIPSGYKEQGEHIQDVFGVKFDPNHTWSTTTTGQVTIKANADTKKVQVLAFSHETDADGDMTSKVNVLNEAVLDGTTQVTLNYDAPSTNDGLTSTGYPMSSAAFTPSSIFVTACPGGCGIPSSSSTFSNLSLFSALSIASQSVPMSLTPLSISGSARLIAV